MNGMILRLAGPLQSWGERSVFGHRDTLGFPTRSGLIGLLAAAEGLDRTESLDRYDPLGITVRIDRPGRLLEDFHTVGGGLPAEQTVPTSTGRRRAADTATLVSRRHYLADAIFVVALTGPDTDLDRLAEALDRPVWAPYLGRRSCPPEYPLVLRRRTDDPRGELLNAVPLSLERPPTAGQATVPVDFIWETPPPGLDTSTRTQRYETADSPVSFAPNAREYRGRTLWRTTEQLPAELYAQRPAITALTDYVLAPAGRQEGTPS